MDIKTKVLITAVSIGILLAVGASFNKIVIKKDYNITLAVSCDNTQYDCFVYEEDGEIDYYRYLTQKAYNFPNCDPKNCEPVCEVGSECEYIYCSPELENEWDTCAE